MRNSMPKNRVSLRLVLIVPFLLQIFAAVGLVGYISWLNGQKAVHELANRLQTEIGDRVTQHLDTYLAAPQQINMTNVQAIRLGLLQLNNLDKLGQYFWKQMQVFPVSYINYGSGDGLFVGVERLEDGKVVAQEDPALNSTRDYVYETDEHGQRKRLIESSDQGADHRDEAWYKDPIKAGKQVWSEVYQWEDKPEILSISSSYPVYNQNSQVIGSIGVDLILSQIGGKLRQINSGYSGQIFILEKDGLLVASSSKSPSFRMVDRKASRLKATEAGDIVVKETAKYLQRQFGGFGQINATQNLNFKIDGKQQFVRIIPWKDKYGLDWLAVLTVPESDFTAQIDANTRSTILLCLAALAVATILGIYTSRWISRPIIRLSQASEAIAEGQFGQTVQEEGARELRTLAQSFNKMAQQLQESFDIMTQTNVELETRVDQRTAQFKKAVRAAMKAAGQSATAVQAEEEAKSEAEAAKRSKEEFFVNLSHDLRTPLNNILGHATLLTHDPDLSEDQVKGAKVIRNNGTLLLALIDDLLHFAALDNHEVQFDPTDFDLPAFLNQVCSATQMRAQGKGLRFQCDFANDLPREINADSKYLRRVLLNLLDNTVKFTSQGAVRFNASLGNRAASPSQQYIVFQVSDTGVGISSANQEAIFEPFNNIGDRQNKESRRSLGLPIAKKIVERMGGTLQVESRLAQGSTFRVEIPVTVVDRTLEKAEPDASRVQGYSGKKRSILIVDANPDNCVFLQKLLSPLGFEVSIAEDGEQGLAIARRTRPDLILTDILMRGKTGLRMTMEIREIPEIQDTPIIALSSSQIEHIEDASLRAGCNAFLPVPIDEQRLLLLLEEHLQVEWIYSNP
jgi:signal transduction histidine kinase/CheY-like chemotaxis protein